jgi:hypothetical protein
VQHQARRKFANASGATEIIPENGQPVFGEMYSNLMPPAGSRDDFRPDPCAAIALL